MSDNTRNLPVTSDMPIAVQRALRTLTGWAQEDQFNNATTSQTLSQLPQMQKSITDLATQIQGRGQTVTLTFAGGFTVNGKTFHTMSFVAGQLMSYD